MKLSYFVRTSNSSDSSVGSSSPKRSLISVYCESCGTKIIEEDTFAQISAIKNNE